VPQLVGYEKADDEICSRLQRTASDTTRRRRGGGETAAGLSRTLQIFLFFTEPEFMKLCKEDHVYVY
jgi:hypothetical protein